MTNRQHGHACKFLLLQEKVSNSVKSYSKLRVQDCAKVLVKMFMQLNGASTFSGTFRGVFRTFCFTFSFGIRVFGGQFVLLRCHPNESQIASDFEITEPKF